MYYYSFNTPYSGGACACPNVLAPVQPMEDERILQPQPRGNLVAHRNQDAPLPPPPLPVHDNQQPLRLLGPDSMDRWFNELQRMVGMVEEIWRVPLQRDENVPTGDTSTPR